MKVIVFKCLCTLRFLTVFLRKSFNLFKMDRTPRRCTSIVNQLSSDDHFQTPKQINSDNVQTSTNFAVPESPFLRRLGYGTCVGVYHMDRTSIAGRQESPWAIKKVLRSQINNKKIKDLLQEEANLLKKLNHPNIIGFRGFSKTVDGREALAMEECTISLGNLIEECALELKGPFEADRILTVCSSVGKALDYLHNDALLMHGDIKSFNILIKGDFECIKLCDFGVSIKVDASGKALGDYVGTDIWSAPEVLNEEIITTKADIFSFGIVIYEMLSLTIPFVTGEENENEDAGENYGTRPKLPEINFGEEYKLVLDLFNWCTEQNPNERPSAKELVIN